MSRPANAATRAEEAADIALKATGLALDAKKEAERHAQAIEKVAPDPHKEIVRELASHEQSVLLSVGPRRHRWRELQRFDEQLAQIEHRREQLRREIGERMAARNNEPLRVSAALDAWLVSGEKGARPQSQVARTEGPSPGRQHRVRRKTQHWQRLRLQRLKLASGLCELRHQGCTRIHATRFV